VERNVCALSPLAKDCLLVGGEVALEVDDHIAESGDAGVADLVLELLEVDDGVEAVQVVDGLDACVLGADAVLVDDAHIGLVLEQFLEVDLHLVFAREGGVLLQPVFVDGVVVVLEFVVGLVLKVVLADGDFVGFELDVFFRQAVFD